MGTFTVKNNYGLINSVYYNYYILCHFYARCHDNYFRCLLSYNTRENTKNYHDYNNRAV